jgi:hypothetical protein
MPTTLLVALPDFTPNPEQIEVKVKVNGADLLTSYQAGDAESMTFQAQYYPQSTYTATAKPVYSPIPCTVGPV